MAYEITGSIVEIGEVKTFDSGFRKRDIVVETGDKFPSPVILTLKKDYCAKADAVKTGDIVTVKFHINGRKWDGPNGTRYFVDLTAFDIIPVKAASAPAASDAETAPEPGEELPF